MSSPLEMLDLVALTTDRPQDGLKKGQDGTVVEVFPEPEHAYEVEFVDPEGYTIALVTARPEELRLVRSHASR